MSTKQSKAIKNAENPLVLTLPEPAAFLRVKENVLAEEAASGRIPARKIGNEWRFLKSVLEEWLKLTDFQPDLNGTLHEMQGMISRLRDELLGKIQTMSPPPSTQNGKERIFSVAGMWKDDDTIDEMLAEIYRRRGRPMIETRRKEIDTRTPKERILALAGVWKDDDTIDEMLADIYRRRVRSMIEGDQ